MGRDYEDLAEEIESLRSEKEGLLLEDANRIGLQKRLDELEAFLDEHQEPLTDYDDGLVRRLVERITVYDDRLAFEFKSGLETEVHMYITSTPRRRSFGSVFFCLHGRKVHRSVLYL